MEFNPDKCEVMHFGRNNVGRSYTINGRAVKIIETQRDLDGQVHKSLKSASQVEVRPVLFAALSEGRGGLRESAEKVYQDVAWYGGS